MKWGGNQGTADSSLNTRVLQTPRGLLITIGRSDVKVSGLSTQSNNSIDPFCSDAVQYVDSFTFIAGRINSYSVQSSVEQVFTNRHVSSWIAKAIAQNVWPIYSTKNTTRQGSSAQLYIPIQINSIIREHYLPSTPGALLFNWSHPRPLYFGAHHWLLQGPSWRLGPLGLWRQ